MEHSETTGVAAMTVANILLVCGCFYVMFVGEWYHHISRSKTTILCGVIVILQFIMSIVSFGMALKEKLVIGTHFGEINQKWDWA